MMFQQDHELVQDSTYSYYWYANNNDWGIYSRTVNTYDAKENLTEHNSYTWDYAINDWVNDSKYVHYWSELETSLSDNSMLFVYPNPFSDYTMIKFLGAFQIQKVLIN